jgi:hypothetical protein
MSRSNLRVLLILIEGLRRAGKEISEKEEKLAIPVK